MSLTQHKLKSIQPIPSMGDFLDIVLSRTQRKTPTVIHKGYAIGRIRSFYMRKVKYTQQTFDEKLGIIIDEFPRLEDIHPFYSDLMNVLYDRDHYKLALAQINTARHLIDNVGKDYLKLLKYGDSLYRCKQLKRAALGRMATIMKRQKESLKYLEQVRQHVQRLPSIDPVGRTLLICGYPNVGKSSFMNKLTRANVDVQPYAFTTKNVFVGHMDYRYLRWQVIDTPGILDHPLEERNTIEMQAITALAHIRACILFFIDISESCGYSIEAQVKLFNSIKSLFSNRPVMIILNKIDLIRPEQILESDKALLQSILDSGYEIGHSSCVTEEGIMTIRNIACDKLLSQRVDQKVKNNRINDILNRLHLAQPQTRDEKIRPPHIPESVLAKRRMIAAKQSSKLDGKNDDENENGDDENVVMTKRLARDIEDAEGGPGVYSFDLKDHYQTIRPEWRYDIIPEIMDGKNIIDFVDPEIEEKLLRLEAEEDQFELENRYNQFDDGMTVEEKSMREMAKKIRERKKLAIIESNLKNNKSNRVPISKIEKRKVRIVALKNKNANKMNTDSDGEEEEGMGREPNIAGLLIKKDRSIQGIKSESDKIKSEKLKKRSMKRTGILAKAGEGDRMIQTAKPKYLYSGKRKAGTHDRR